LPGNSVLAGHVVLADGTPGSPARLAELSWGETILIHGGGFVHVCEVRRSSVLPAGDLSPLEHEDDDWVTPITCVGFDPQTEAYPWRLAVQAVLLSVYPSEEPKTVAER
jgi:sortase (surface protein transpeptidase)